MRYIELIAREVVLRCNSSGIEGVRLSPLRLEAEEVPDLVMFLRRDMGEGLHLAVSAPGLNEVREERLYLGDREETARVATHWRNTIDSDAGERLVYIAHQRWAKAGGLDETLLPVSESDLRQAFVREALAQGLDRKLTDALQAANLLGKVPARSLCEFCERVTCAEDQAAAAGANLPLLNLAQDSGLSEADLVDRLKANKKLVHKAITGERSKSTKGPGKAMADAVRSEGASGLARVDLGGFGTEELRGKKPITAKTGGAKPAKKKQKKKAKKRAKSKSGGGEDVLREGTDHGYGSGGGTAVLVDALVGTREERDAKIGALGNQRAGAGSSEGEEEATTEADHLARLLGSSSTIEMEGLDQVIRELVTGEGWRRQYQLKEGVDIRAALKVPLQGGLTPTVSPLAEPSLQGAVRRWETARSAFVESFAAGTSRERVSLPGLIRAPFIAIAGEEVYSSAVAFLEATRRLYSEAHARGEATLAREVLALDTVTFAAGAEAQLTVVSPLHPLWLGQAVARLEQIREHRDSLNKDGARLIARAFSRTPSAPQLLPLICEAEAQLAPVLGGLICYETRPALAADETLADIGRRLAAAYLRVHPYAALGLRVRLHGGSPGPLIDGLAQALEHPEELARLEVCTAQVPGPLQRAVSRTALEEGRLTFQPDRGGVAPPHIEVALGPLRAPVQDVRPVTAEVAGFSPSRLTTTFRQFHGGLRAVTQVAGVPGVEEFEALHATAFGWAPRGAFMVEPRGVSLSAVLRHVPAGPGVWRVAIASGMARDHGDGRRLLAFERHDSGITTAVECDSTAAASRVLEPSLRRLEIPSTSPRMLRTLAHRLADTGRGLLALGRHQSAQLAGLLLEADLRREAAASCAHVTAAQLRGQALSALAEVTGPWAGAFCLCAGVSGERLQLSVGYSAIEDPLDYDIAKGGHLQGDLAEALGNILSAIEVAQVGAGVAKVCALESLRWALCPAASEEPETSRVPLLEALAGFGAGVPADLRVMVLFPQAYLSARRPAPAKLKGQKVEFHLLDAEALDRLVMAPTR
jgi:hypothetical protein